MTSNLLIIIRYIKDFINTKLFPVKLVNAGLGQIFLGQLFQNLVSPRFPAVASSTVFVNYAAVSIFYNNRTLAGGHLMLMCGYF